MGEVPDDSGLKSVAAKWLFHQGASTVFAITMLAGIFWIAPSIVKQIQESQAESTANLKAVAEKFDREQERTFQYLIRLQDQRK